MSFGCVMVTHPQPQEPHPHVVTSFVVVRSSAIFLESYQQPPRSTVIQILFFDRDDLAAAPGGDHLDTMTPGS